MAAFYGFLKLSPPIKRAVIISPRNVQQSPRPHSQLQIENINLYVSRLQEVGETATRRRGWRSRRRRRRIHPFHFRFQVQRETLQPPKPPSRGVAIPLGAGRVATLDCGRLFRGIWAGTSRAKPNGKQTKKQTNKQ